MRVQGGWGEGGHQLRGPDTSLPASKGLRNTLMFFKFLPNQNRNEGSSSGPPCCVYRGGRWAPGSSLMCAQGPAFERTVGLQNGAPKAIYF